VLQQAGATSEASCHTSGEAQGWLREPPNKLLLFDPRVTACQKQGKNINSKKVPLLAPAG